MTRHRYTTQEKKLIQLLKAVFTLCSLDRLLTAKTLDRLISDARLQAQKKVSKLSPKGRPSVDHYLIGYVVYHWQRSSNYLDETGRPFPIPLRGPTPSVEALFKTLNVQKQFPSALTQFKSQRRIRVTRNGLYVPRLEATIIPTLTPEVVESLAHTINCLVATVLHNTKTGRNQADRLFERVAYVPDFPIAKLPDYKQFVREHAGGLVETVNEWLENQRGRAPRMTSARGKLFAGLHVFAFVNKHKR